MKEAAYQNHLIEKIEHAFPGAMVLKNNPNHIQGIPDLIVLWRQFWAALEVKVSKDAPTQPNQPYWIEKLGEHSYASFIYPENEEEVFNALQLAFRT